MEDSYSQDEHFRLSRGESALSKMLARHIHKGWVAQNLDPGEMFDKLSDLTDSVGDCNLSSGALRASIAGLSFEIIGELENRIPQEPQAVDVSRSKKQAPRERASAQEPQVHFNYSSLQERPDKRQARRQPRYPSKRRARHTSTRQTTANRDSRRRVSSKRAVRSYSDKHGTYRQRAGWR